MYRADTIDITPTRPEHVLLVAEVVSPGSETTDRIVKADQYARAGIGFYWRTEQAATGVLKAAAPFPVEIDLGQVRATRCSVPPGKAPVTGR